jgi:cell division protein FtsL
MSIEVVFEKRINNVNVYRDVDVAQRRQYFLLTFLSAMFVLGLLLYGWQQYRWLRLGYDIEKLKEKKEELLDYQHQLLVERNLWGNAQYIDNTARNSLGMVAAAPGQIVSLSVDDVNSTPPSTDVAAVR